MTTPGKHRISPTARAYSSSACFIHELEPASAVERDVHIKRIYDEPARSDGCRVLVDRIWPRGIKKRDAALDDWARELAPSTELRKWFGHDPKRWPEFRKRYRFELRQRASQLNALRQRAAHRRVTLLYGARDRQFNQAVVLKELIQES
jgi:uncharacterized protein YeaO (DUF488 family)